MRARALFWPVTPMLAIALLACAEADPLGLDRGPADARGVELARDASEPSVGPDARPDVGDAGIEDRIEIIEEAGPSDAPDPVDPPDAGLLDGTTADAGSASPGCPDPISIDCSQPHAECIDNCAINCIPALPVAGVLDCTRLATCGVRPFGMGQDLATCEGQGWFEACDTSYPARCDGEVAIFCERGQIRLSTCPSFTQCWAQGSEAGCN